MANKDSHNGPLSRDFKGIYNVLRDMALRGYRNGNEYSNIFISKKKYDKVLSKIRFMLEQKEESELLKEQKQDGQKQYYFLNQPMKWQDNPYAKVWRYAVPNRKKLFFYINILGALDSSEGKTINEIREFVKKRSCQLEEQKEEEEVDVDVEEEVDADKKQQEIRDGVKRSLKKMEEQMLIRSEKKAGKKERVYYLEKPIWDGFTERELKKIYTYLEFLKNAMVFELPYYLLQENLELYMSIKHIKLNDNENKKIFLFRNRNIINVLDSEKIYVFLRGLKNKESLHIISTDENIELHRLERGKSTSKQKTANSYEKDVLVEKVIYNIRNGAFVFALSHQEKEGRFTAHYTAERVEFDSRKKPEALRDIFHIFHSVYFDKILYLYSQKEKSWSKAELETMLFGKNIDSHISMELLTQKGEYWLFPYEEDEKEYSKHYDDKIRFISTRLHREALKSFEEIPFTEIFLHPDIIAKIKEKMQLFESGWNINDIKKEFYWGKECEVDPVTKYTYEQMQSLLKAIRNRWIVMDKQKKSYMPLKLQYSVRREGFRLLAYDPEQEKCRMILWDEIDFAGISGNNVKNKEYIEKFVEKGKQQMIKQQKKLTLKLTAVTPVVNSDNLLTRQLFMLLSSYERVVHYSEEKGEFEIEITYWPDDEEELIEDLKKFGEGFHVEILK